MNQHAISARLRNAGIRIMARAPLTDLHQRTAVECLIADAHHVLDLADLVEEMEERLRPRTPREAAAGAGRARRAMRALCRAFSRGWNRSGRAAPPAARTAPAASASFHTSRSR